MQLEGRCVRVQGEDELGKVGGDVVASRGDWAAAGLCKEVCGKSKMPRCAVEMGMCDCCVCRGKRKRKVMMGIWV